MKRILYGKVFNVIDLSNDGYCGLIFDVISCIQFMYLTTKNGELIQGGDIITNINGKYEVSCDNWFTNSNSPEDTFLTSLDFLKSYMKKNINVDWKVSVVTSNLSELINLSDKCGH